MLAREFLGSQKARIFGNPEQSSSILSALKVFLLGTDQTKTEEQARALVFFYLVTNEEADPTRNSLISEYYHPFNKMWQLLEQLRSAKTFSSLMVFSSILSAAKASQDLYEKLVLIRTNTLLLLSMDRTCILSNYPFVDKERKDLFEVYDSIKDQLVEGDILIDSYRQAHERATPALIFAMLTGGLSLDSKIVHDESLFDFPMASLVLSFFNHKFNVFQANSGHLRGSAVLVFSYGETLPSKFDFLKSYSHAYEVSPTDKASVTQWLGFRLKEGNQMMLKIKYLSVYDLIEKLSEIERIFNDAFSN